MRWKGRRQSSNVEDRRRRAGRLPGPKGKLSVGVIVLAIVAYFMGIDPMQILQLAETPAVSVPNSPSMSSELEDETAQFVATILADTEDTWHHLFQEMGQTYREPKLVLFRNSVQSACGFNTAATGPFYCPGDDKVYLDLSFFDELARRFQAPGDFAQAYVVAHEVGHHIQNILGISKQVQAQRGKISQEAYNQLSVRLELQADFLAGVWAHHTHERHDILEGGDIEEALRAASAIGDDRLQKQSRGYVQPETFTHGTSEQRVRWFNKGLETGDLKQGDTFRATQL